MLKTKRLTLKAMTEADTEAALDLLTNGIIKQTYMLPDFEQRSDALPQFHRIMTLSQDPSRFVKGIYLNDHLIGSMNEVERIGDAVEIGYLLHPDHHNQGYMTEALSAVFPYLFRMGFQEVICGAFEHNKASLRVMEKAGMTLMDRTDNVTYKGKVYRCVYYQKNRKER